MKMQRSCLFFIISVSLIAVILQAPESHAMRLPLAQQSNHHSNHHSLNDQQIRMQQRKAIASLRVKRQARETEYE